MATADRPPVTVLKPLCGKEPLLYENLTGFCTQEYPDYHIVFGVPSPHDQSLAVVDRVRRDHPERDITVVVDARRHGANRKVSTLINLMPYAAHDLLVVADSDISVAPDYLHAVTAPLGDPEVGVVTCLYGARAVNPGWAAWGARFVNDWFRTAVRVGHLLGSRDFGFGATLAFRRTTLADIGGFAALRDHLADDYWLARKARGRGLRTVLSPVEVTTDVVETRFTDLWAREVRWLRTIRSLNPVGFVFMFVSFPMPWLLCGLWSSVAWFATASGPAGETVVHLAVGLLVLAALLTRCVARRLSLPGLVANVMRDALLCAEWAAALFGTTVTWRGVRLSVDRSSP